MPLAVELSVYMNLHGLQMRIEDFNGVKADGVGLLAGYVDDEVFYRFIV